LKIKFLFSSFFDCCFVWKREKRAKERKEKNKIGGKKKLPDLRFLETFEVKITSPSFSL